MSGLHKDAVLRLADHLTLRPGAHGLEAHGLDAPLTLDEQDVRLIGLFVQPRTLEDVAGAITAGATSTHQFMLATAQIMALVKRGVLVSADGETPVSPRPPRPMTPTEAKLHLDLLRDEARSRAYIAALHQAVRPGDVVIDLGTGNGILAMAAARAGARHVYAIEGGPVAETTRRIFAANGFADRITVLEGWSTVIAPPEQADVLVSEVLSNDVFTENHLQSVSDALRRMVRPDARIIPHAAQIFGRLVQIPPDHRGNRAISMTDVDAWRARYGFDFSPLYEGQWHGQTTIRVAGRSVIGQWAFLSDSTPIGSVTLDKIDSLAYRAQAEFVVTQAGRLDGLMGHFDLDVLPGIRITTDPFAPDADRADSWYHETWLIPPIDVTPGDRFRVTLTHEYRQPLSVDVTIEPI